MKPKQIILLTDVDLVNKIKIESVSNSKTMLFLLGELYRRNLDIDKETEQKISDFISFGKIVNIKEAINSVALNYGYSTYFDFYNELYKQVGFEPVYEQQNQIIEDEDYLFKKKIDAFMQNNNQKVQSAGRALKNTVYLIITSLLFVVIGLVIWDASSTIETQKIILIVTGVFCLIFNIISLYQLFKAGDYLDSI